MEFKERKECKGEGKRRLRERCGVIIAWEEEVREGGMEGMKYKLK